MKRKKYIDSLQEADKNEPQSLVDFFCEVEKRNIEEVLNLKLDVTASKKSLEEIADVFSQKVGTQKHGIQKERLDKIQQNRTQVFEYCDTVLNETVIQLKRRISEDVSKIYVETAYPESERFFWFSHQIVDYAILHDYFFNRTLPRGWFKVAFVLSEKRQYQLVISIHHYGYDDSTVAVGAFLEFIESSINRKLDPNGTNRKGQNDNTVTSVPLTVKPHIISLEADISKLESNLKSFIQDTVSIALGQIASEIG